MAIFNSYVILPEGTWCYMHKTSGKDRWGFRIFRYLQISDFSFGQATIHESLGFKLDLQVPLQTATAKSSTLLDKAREAMLIQCGQRNSALNSAHFGLYNKNIQKLYNIDYKETMYIYVYIFRTCNGLVCFLQSHLCGLPQLATGVATRWGCKDLSFRATRVRMAPCQECAHDLHFPGKKNTYVYIYI